jgi:hypothetical protein
MKSYVYVISGEHGRQKIGSSDNPAQRIKDLQTGSPFPLKFEFIGEVENNAGGQVEVEAHFTLNQHKAPGGDEWFVVPSDVAITAVMAAAHRLGYRIKPVDTDSIAGKSIALGPPGWHKVVKAAVVIAALLPLGWLLYMFDSGQIHVIALVISALVLIGVVKLVQYGLIELGNSIIRFDRLMHPDDGVKVPLSLD